MAGIFWAGIAMLGVVLWRFREPIKTRIQTASYSEASDDELYDAVIETLRIIREHDSSAAAWSAALANLPQLVRVRCSGEKRRLHEGHSKYLTQVRDQCLVSPEQLGRIIDKLNSSWQTRTLDPVAVSECYSGIDTIFRPPHGGHAREAHRTDALTARALQTRIHNKVVTIVKALGSTRPYPDFDSYPKQWISSKDAKVFDNDAISCLTIEVYPPNRVGTAQVLEVFARSSPGKEWELVFQAFVLSSGDREDVVANRYDNGAWEDDLAKVLHLATSQGAR